MENLRSPFFDRWALRYARWALAAAFLSGIASRFGLWGPGQGYGTFAIAMAISFGIKEPLDYSVFSASAAALLVASHPSTEHEAA